MKQEIINRVKQVIANYNNKVEQGLSSIYAQDDVTLILSEVISEVETSLNQIQIPTTSTSEEGSFTIADLRKALREVDYEQHIEIDNLEFCIGYRNTIELDSCDKTFDIESFRDELIGHIESAKEDRLSFDGIYANVTNDSQSSNTQVEAYNENN
jgi:hypothetical protein